ncbi:MAG: hypothetical protein BJ554DRAFT_4997 [Olpidium bornovanus]|uniref:CTCHY-type domain-containing protein n=1 Tax=Olpidium bornovanus TaxID=278681 RepID=A0A8H7ZMA2_9FUNG|nr:MAG: hypothetical protein BJ554DRAFT_4997 [Olpidium bornovanus]
MAESGPDPAAASATAADCGDEAGGRANRWDPQHPSRRTEADEGGGVEDDERNEAEDLGDFDEGDFSEDEDGDVGSIDSREEQEAARTQLRKQIIAVQADTSLSMTEKSKRIQVWQSDGIAFLGWRTPIRPILGFWRRLAYCQYCQIRALFADWVKILLAHAAGFNDVEMADLPPPAATRPRPGRRCSVQRACGGRTASYIPFENVYLYRGALANDTAPGIHDAWVQALPACGEAPGELLRQMVHVPVLSRPSERPRHCQVRAEPPRCASAWTGETNIRRSQLWDDLFRANRRNQTKNMLCMYCSTTQPAAQYCKNERCRMRLGRYYCNECKLWDDDPRKNIYHCPECKICRIGKGLGEDFFHCKKCNVRILPLAENRILPP